MADRVYTLRVKKIFFDRILSGDKTTEYRDYKPFYKGIEADDIGYIKFHYQTGAYILCRIKSVEVIPTPERIRESSIPFGDRVYSIALGDILEHRT